MSALRLHYVTHSEIGLVRKNNQDSGYASPQLLVVADGMGGAAAGDLASAVAIDSIRRIDTGAPVAQSEEMLALLSGAIHRANDRIADLVDDDHALEGMGTTLTGALFDGATLGLAHIGDSRAYLFREHRLTRLTHDHSWVQSLIDDGRISESEAAIHPHRSLLLKVLNGQASSEPDLATVALQAGDRLLFCSDGLCGLVDDSVMARLLDVPDLDQVLAELVHQAHLGGGIDNITVILADVVGGDGETEVVVNAEAAGDPAAAKAAEATEAGAADAAPPAVATHATPVQAAVVLGAAAERTVPPTATKARQEANEDTVVNGKPVPAATDADAVLLLDEDQLDETVTTESGNDDESRYNPRPPSRGRAARRIGLVVMVLLVLGALLAAGYAWTRTQYFVGASGDHVAIFQGLSDPLPGVRLSRVYEVQPLAVSSLPAFYQEKVRATIDVADLAAARQAVNELADVAIRCAAQPTPSNSPTPKPSKSGKPSTSASSTPPPTGPEPNC